MEKIIFTVPGQPVPQPRARVTTRGKFAHAYTPAKHPITAYREAIKAAAIAAGAKPHGELVTVFVVASFVRPASHRTKKGLKKDAPKTPKPDGDNLLKGILDALNGIAYEDDTQAEKIFVWKRYAVRAETRVTIE